MLLQTCAFWNQSGFRYEEELESTKSRGHATSMSTTRFLLGRHLSGIFLVLSMATLGYVPCLAQVNVLTGNGSNDRINANLQETKLTPANVSPGQFGKLGSLPVDGQIYSQPLYVSGLSFP